jgi:hypothetical protein
MKISILKLNIKIKIRMIEKYIWIDKMALKKTKE